MQNYLSKYKAEVEIEHGRRLFFQTGSSYNSTVDWDIFTKFGTQIEMGHVKRTSSPNWKPEVDLRRQSAPLKKSK